ncbi:hypothetical protein FJY84_00290 [Candidatus Bathyarchaeota archaeon]|nr:hypothetical protein [Candidatus Bathyarchaeota archaeon]
MNRELKGLINITIRLYGELRSSFSNKNSLILEVDENFKIIDLFNKLNLKQDDIFVTLVNGQAQNFQHTLKENDLVDIFPFLIGG